MQTNGVARHGRYEVEPDAKFLELDGDGVREALHDRDWNFATCEEAGFLAVVSDQVRLRETLKEAAIAQRADHGAEVVLLAEEEDVQQIAERELAFRFCDLRTEITAFLAEL